MADQPSADRPWRTLGGAEGRAARIEEVRRLAAEGLDAHQISERIGVAGWVVERDLAAGRPDAV